MSTDLAYTTGMVEHWGGKLGVLGYPMHGKASTVALHTAGRGEGEPDGGLFTGVPPEFEVRTCTYNTLL
jgi:anthranilate synthase